jgi:hypothetical protein
MEEQDEYIQSDFSNIAYYSTDYESPDEPRVMTPISLGGKVILAVIGICVALTIILVSLN